jgi:aminoglycoside phosphotransferase (APT) family kinase protein
MWALKLPEPDLDTVLQLSRASRDLVGLIQAQPRTCAKLRELAEAPDEQSRLIHGDLRWENCLRVAAHGSARRSGTTIIDWELARRGDPAFDVGTVIAEYLANWVESIPVFGQTPHPHEAERPLARDVVGAFWSGYRHASAAPPTLRRVAELAGLRLLQTAIERTQSAHQVSSTEKLLMNMSENMLLAPETGAYSLIGLQE